MIYYDQDGITVRASTESDVEYLKDRIRRADIDEIWASHRHTPDEALRLSLRDSALCLTIDNNGTPVGMFGVVPDSIMGDKAVVWFLASDELGSIKIRFIRNCKFFIKLMLEHYPYLYNFVDCRNKESIKWLKVIGAKFGITVNIGLDKMPFRYFSFEEK